jgi:hypothetical protein
MDSNVFLAVEQPGLLGDAPVVGEKDHLILFTQFGENLQRCPGPDIVEVDQDIVGDKGHRVVTCTTRRKHVMSKVKKHLISNEKPMNVLSGKVMTLEPFH